MYKLGFEEAEEPEIKLTFAGSWRNQGNSRKTSTASLTLWNADCVDHNKLQKILKEMRRHFTCLLRNLYVGEEAKLEVDMERCISSKLGKE